jgi:hypothetical protein
MAPNGSRLSEKAVKVRFSATLGEELKVVVGLV